MIILSFLCKSDKIRPHKNIGAKMVNPENDDMDEQEFFTGDIDTDTIEASVRSMLSAFGEDPNREGLQNTPKRVARMYPELLSGYRTDVEKLVNGAIFNVTYDDMVIVRDIEYFSLCEHHMLPFMGRPPIAGFFLGLSSLSSSNCMRFSL